MGTADTATAVSHAGCAVYAKAVHLDLTGRIEDRMACCVQARADRAGRIKPGDVIAAATGNAGIAVAAIGRAPAHPVEICVPDSISHERVAAAAAGWRGGGGPARVRRQRDVPDDRPVARHATAGRLPVAGRRAHLLRGAAARTALAGRWRARRPDNRLTGAAGGAAPTR
jgi:hypothetical protein